MHVQLHCMYAVYTLIIRTYELRIVHAGAVRLINM